jgi:hypothetical protein
LSGLERASADLWRRCYQNDSSASTINMARRNPSYDLATTVCNSVNGRRADLRALAIRQIGQHVYIDRTS